MALSEHLVPALEAHLAENGGGMITGYLCVVDFVGADGDQGNLIVSTMDGQRTILSMGMAEYAREWFADDARFQMSSAACDHDEDD